jgi:hypothetical protein
MSCACDNTIMWKSPFSIADCCYKVALQAAAEDELWCIMSENITWSIFFTIWNLVEGVCSHSYCPHNFSCWVVAYCTVIFATGQYRFRVRKTSFTSLAQLPHIHTAHTVHTTGKCLLDVVTKVTSINGSSQICDTCVHLLSCALVSQSTSEGWFIKCSVT